MTQIRDLLAAHPEWSRRRLSEVLCAAWDWRNRAGQLKDMATRSLLLKLEASGLIQLPVRRRSFQPAWRLRLPPRLWTRRPSPARSPNWTPGGAGGKPGRCGAPRVGGRPGPVPLLEPPGRLSARISIPRAECPRALAGWPGVWVGGLECGARDEFIGWSAEQRPQQLHLLTNNSRFRPTVRHGSASGESGSGPSAAAAVAGLGETCGYPIVLVETFVETRAFCWHLV